MPHLLLLHSLLITEMPSAWSKAHWN